MPSGASAVILDNREKGQFPVSIATSLALEGAFGILEDDKPKPEIPPILKHQEFWFNLRTLFRNLHGSIKKEEEINLSPKDYAEALQEEMLLIRNILETKTGNRVVPVFYACDYNSLTSIFKHSQFREVKTEKQKHYSAIENRALEILQGLLKEQGLSFYHFDTTIRGHGKSTLMMSHYPIDLVSNTNIPDLVLVESHTGAIKPKAHWYTKLLDGKNLPRIPFDIMTIQVFGDHGHLFKPYPKEVRDALLEIAEKHKWTPVTSKERIKLTIKVSNKPTLEGLVMKLYSTIL